MKNSSNTSQSIPKVHALLLALTLATLLASCGGGSDSTSTAESSSDGMKTVQAVGSGVVPPSWKGRAPRTTPDLTWSPKEISVNGKSITYVLGEGNPKDVSLAPSEYKASEQQPGENYVRPQTESALVRFLGSQNLQDLMLACSSNGVPSPLSYPKDFSVEKWLYIDQETKRKQINNISVFGDWLIFLRPFGEAVGDAMVSKCFSGNNAKAKATISAVRAEFSAVGKEYYNQVK